MKKKSEQGAVEAGTSGRRERKVQRTRRHIAEAAVALFVAKGFAATTIEEIVAAADYSTSTFFRLFADKEEVIFFDFGDRLDELQATFAAPHPSSWATIRSALLDFAERWDADGELARQRAHLFHQEPGLRSRYLMKNHEWEEAIARLLLAELGDSAETRLDARLIAGSAVGAFRSAWQVQQESDMPLAECVRQAFDQLEQIGRFFRGGGRARRASG
jgi:AcrR family transcriptional regulator